MSEVPPGAKPTKIRTGRAGYTNADAVRDVAVRTAAPAANCRNSLRESFIDFTPRRATLAGGYRHQSIGGGHPCRTHLSATYSQPAGSQLTAAGSGQCPGPPRKQRHSSLVTRTRATDARAATPHDVMSAHFECRCVNPVRCP